MKAGWRSLAVALSLSALATTALADPVLLRRQATTTTSSSSSSVTSSSSTSSATTASQSSTSISTFSLATTASLSSLSSSISTSTSTSASASASSSPSSNTTSQGAATFVTSDSGEGNVTFTLTTNSAGDFWFRLAAPSFFSWMAVGFGDRMDGTLMFVAYRDSSEHGMTLSPRISGNHVEPSFSSQITMGSASVQKNDTHPDGANGAVMIVTGYCKNCSAIAPRKVDVNSKTQSFIWALGPPGHNSWSGAPDGPLRRHDYFGHFMMDLTAARGDGVPILGATNINATPMGGIIQDHEYADGLHAFLMGVTFLIVFPVGALMLRAWNNLRMHSMLQTGGVLCALIGAFTGFYLSTLYNRSRGFNTAHQILGLFIILALLAQWSFGFLNHRHHLKHQIPWASGKPIKIHKYLGPITIALGLINVALGFRLAIAAYFNLFYAPLVIGIMFIITVISVTKKIMHVRRARRGGQPGNGAFMGSANMPGGSGGPGAEAIAPQYLSRPAGTGPYGNHHQAGYEPSRSDIQLQNLGEPPVHHMPPVQPKHMI